MTASPWELALYAGALFVLFLTPGPVWVALTARAIAGGFQAAWPLALGVVVGDVIWPILAILGVSWILDQFEHFMTVLRILAAVIFWWMGINLLRHSHDQIEADQRLAGKGGWASFAAGVAVILGNPKAILFYMGVLPGFFDLTAVTGPDIAAIAVLSFAVPLIGNLILAGFIHRLRGYLTSGRALARLNRISGVLLILVGCAIPFT